MAREKASGWDSESTASSSAPSSSSSKPVRLARWAPSRRELRKYASLFLRTDTDLDGFVDPSEAWSLCKRSQLDERILGHAWEHADRDRDGRLNFPEFVTLVHIVTCGARGAEVPVPADGLPREFEDALSSLTESPEELQAERSSSSSRSGSTSPAPSSVAPAEVYEGSWASPKAVHSTLPSSSSFPADGWAAPECLGDEETGSKHRHRKPRKKHKSDEDTDDGGGSERNSPLAAMGEDSPGRHVTPWKSGVENVLAAADTSPLSPHFGATAAGGTKVGFKSPDKAADVIAVRRHLEAFLAADRVLWEQQRSDANVREEEFKKLREEHVLLEQQVRRQREHIERQLELQQQLERQVLEAHGQLARLREERRALNIEVTTVQEHHRHFSEELAFLRQTFEEEERVLKDMRHSNDYFDKCCKGLQEHTVTLDTQRKETISMIDREKKLLHRDARKNTEMRSQLEGMRRGDASAGLGVSASRRHRSPTTDDDSVEDESPAEWPAGSLAVRTEHRSPPEASRRGASTWASSLVGGNVGTPFGGGIAGAHGTLPNSRQGV